MRVYVMGQGMNLTPNEKSRLGFELRRVLETLSQNVPRLNFIVRADEFTGDVIARNEALLCARESFDTVEVRNDLSHGLGVPCDLLVLLTPNRTLSGAQNNALKYASHRHAIVVNLDGSELG